MTAAGHPLSRPRPRVLFVDDEPEVLDAVAVNLRRNYDVVTATSGAAGLEYLEAEDDFAVVVSDMRMPKMDGATFLALAREISPDVVRMLLTGHSDIDATIKAVNHGQLFRFLTKPCAKETLIHAIECAVTQHRLITGERVLLEQTLNGSIKMLFEILAITSPAAFGRANQIKILVLQLARQLGVLDTWQLEIAALASQLGFIVVPHEVCEKLAHKLPLSDDEQRMVARAPAMTEQLLANIPRLESVRAMLALHVHPPPRKPNADPAVQRIELGAHLLRVAIDIEAFESTRRDRSTSPVSALLARADLYDHEVLEAAEDLYSKRPANVLVKAVHAGELVRGMVLAEDVRLVNGTLLVARGYEVTSHFIERINNFPPGVFAGQFRVIASC